MLYTISKCFNIRSKAMLLAFTIMLIGAGCASTKTGGVAAPGAAGTSGERSITGISTSDEAGAVKVRILGNSPLRYTSVKQSSPLGIVLYFPGTKLEGVQPDYPPQGELLDSVKTSQQDHASGSDSRIKILLTKDVDYDVVREENSLVISLAKPDAHAENGAAVVSETEPVTANDASSVTEEPVTANEGTEALKAASTDKEELEEVSVQSVEEKTVEKTADATNPTVESTEVAAAPDNGPVESPTESLKTEEAASIDKTADNTSDSKSAEAQAVEPVSEIKPETPSGDMASASAEGSTVKAEVTADPVIDISETVAHPDSETLPPAVSTVVETEKNATKVIAVKKKVEGDHVVVDIKADGKIKDYKIFTIPGDKKTSARIVCDIYKLNGIKAKGEQKIAVNSKGVTQVRYCSTASKTRVVVDTNNDNLKTYNASAHDEGIEIQIGTRLLADSGSIDKEPHGSVMADEPVKAIAVSEPVAKETVSETPPVEKAEPTPAVSEATSDATPAPAEKEAHVAQEKNWVKRVDFTSEKNGKSVFTIETAYPVKYTTKKKDKKTIHFRLYDTTLPKSRKFPFITTRFDSAVNRIIPVQTRRMKDNALFIIELRQAVPFSVNQQDGIIRIDFAKSSVRPKPESKAGLAPWKAVLSRTSEIRDIEMEASGAESPRVSSAGSVSDGKVVELRAGSSTDPVRELDRGADLSKSRMDSKSSGSLYGAPSDADLDIKAPDPGYSSFIPKKRYTGEKISVDFFETDIKNVFRIIRAVSGQNFAIDKDVSGKVTMTLDKPVPWDQVLDLVLKMNMLGMTTEGGIHRIATLETLKQEEEKRLEYIAAEEKTKMKKKDLEPLITEYILINYSNADKEILPHLEKIITKDRGKASVDTRTNQVILTDTKDVIKQARNLIRKLDKITPQVIIEARIVEATTTFSRNLGTEWGINSNPNYDIYNDTLGGTYGYKVAMNNTVAAESSIGINFTKLSNAQFLLNAKLLAMESKGEGKIISAPKVLTMDNKEATIVQGVEVPFSTVSSDGTQTTFKKIELKLTVTPHVTADNKIALKVLIDKNDVGGVTDLGPTITTKKVESELLISDGDTIVIGGIIKSNKSMTEEGFPLLQHIPVLGWLFKSRIQSEDKQELLVFLTPRIVSYEETER